MYGLQEEKAWKIGSLLWSEHRRGGKGYPEMRLERQAGSRSFKALSARLRNLHSILKTVGAIDGFYVAESYKIYYVFIRSLLLLYGERFEGDKNRI